MNNIKDSRATALTTSFTNGVSMPEFQKGQKVAVFHAYESNETKRSYEIHEIVQVTRHGRLKLENGRSYDQSGREVGNVEHWRTFLAPLTQNIADEVFREKFLKEIRSVPWENLDTVVFEKVKNVLDDLTRQ